MGHADDLSALIPVDSSVIEHHFSRRNLWHVLFRKSFLGPIQVLT